MSIKNKIIGYVASTVVDKISKSSQGQSIIDKFNEYMGIVDSQEIIDNRITKKHYVIVKAHSFSVVEVLGTFKDITQTLSNAEIGNLIYDEKHKKIYRYKYSNIGFFSEQMNLVDSDNKLIGSVKKIERLGIPYLESHIRHYRIKYGGNEIIKYRTYTSCGDFCIEKLLGQYSIKQSITNDVVCIMYKRKVIALIHEIPYNFKGGMNDKYIIEYDDEKDKDIVILIMIMVEMLDKRGSSQS